MDPAIGTKTITVVELTCQRCGYKWTPRKDISDVRICPGCKTASWDIPKNK